ncbi:hypothetical protein [Kibdelosporangium banguiense]|uniref:hypothetical protein n=1 Tax=Kibdelosporangium banguiense TaxID=1365924 RepID=UPI001AE5A1F8|nr:hypothetical protein [Kibdelosporangium banguiense]
MLTVLLSLLVAAGAVGASAYLRIKREAAAAPPNTPTTSAVPQGPVTCRVEPCSVMLATIIGSTKIELIADAGARSGRLRIGDDRLIEATITGRGAVLTPKSLHCTVGTLSACMIRGDVDGNAMIGEVVVGRSGKWSATGQQYLATGGYLSLANVRGDGAPEVVAVQRGYFAQVFTLDGAEIGCTAVVNKPDKLPGWPTVHPADNQLRKPCP